MTRVSTHYKLHRSQASLEFVDVDIKNDVPLFLDAGAIRLLPTTLAGECASLIQSFFGEVIMAIQAGKNDRARALLSSLNEPNETRLGLSDGKASGHGMGAGLAQKLWDRLRLSQAVTSGVLQDLEETSLFVEGIDRDVISDIVTNIIRGPLIDFTQTMCTKYGIPTKRGIAMNVWDRGRRTWVERRDALPVAAGEPLLLVPRNFVRRRRSVFASDRYYRHYVVPYLQSKEFNASNGLRRMLADGSSTLAYKKDVIEKFPNHLKKANTQYTEEEPLLLQEYREDVAKDFEAVSHDDLAAATSSHEPDFDALLADVLAVAPGREGATDYHRAVEKLLTALFYPALDQPVIEQLQHDGRKFIDIQYTNIASKGFFNWLHAVHGTPCGFVPVECKNYKSKIGNKEYDQLTGRFSVQRGTFGILCYRGFVNKADVVKHCKDSAKDGRGYIVALDDADLKLLVNERKVLLSGEDFSSLHTRFLKLIS